MKNISKVFSTVVATMMLMQPAVSLAIVSSKDESVYTNYDSYGNVMSSSVVEHLGVDGNEEVEDSTELKDVLNLNGTEKYTLLGNKIKWQNLGKDIYYKGTTEEELPIKTEIKYYLDDKETSVEEMIGKSGKVKVQMNFTNNLKNEVKIDGKKETLYTPFVVTVGTILKNDKNSNITINNGKSVDTGTKNVIVGLATPGLYESLNIEELKDLNNVTIDFDTTDFSLSNIYVVATPKLIEKSDLKIFDKMDEVVEDANKLQENMDKIEDGANQVADGTSMIKESLKNSIDKMDSSSYKSIDDNTMNSISKAAASEANLTEAQKSQISSGVEQKINGAINPSNIAIQAAKSAVIKAYITSTGASKEIATASIEALLQVSSNFESPNGAVMALMQQGKNQTEAVTIVTSLKTVYDTAYGTAEATASSIKTGLTSSMPDAVVDVAQTTAKKTASLTAEGVASKVADEFTSQTVNSLKTLYDAIGKLETGVIDLSNGITKFNDEGINKLSNYADKLYKYSAKAEALTKLSNDYAGFAADNCTSTTFVGVIKSAK